MVRCVFCVLLFSSGSDLKEEIIHDVDTALPKLEEWKAHILRAAHQDSAKRDVIDKLSNPTGSPNNGLGHEIFASATGLAKRANRGT